MTDKQRNEDDYYRVSDAMYRANVICYKQECKKPESYGKCSIEEMLSCPEAKRIPEKKEEDNKSFHCGIQHLYV